MTAASVPVPAAGAGAGAPAAGVRERVVRFGPARRLAGILSLPRARRAGVPHVVFVNAGIIHRVGPNRLYVDLARALGALGYPALRFDLSGLGDSEAGDGGASLSESAVADIRAALDYLAESRQAAHFLVFGLCSGANYSLLAAFADPRVVGTLLIDPTVTRTLRSHVVHLGRRLRNLATWRALLTLRHPVWQRSLRRFRSSVAVAEAATAQSGQRTQPEERQLRGPEIRASLERVLARGMHLMLVFTGGVNHVYNYREQLFDLLPGLAFGRQLRLEFMPETDHTVSDVRSRAALVESVGAWVTRWFPGAAPSGEGA